MVNILSHVIDGLKGVADGDVTLFDIFQLVFNLLWGVIFQFIKWFFSQTKDFFIVLVCKDHIPYLYIDGNLVAHGEASLYSPHPSVLTDSSCPKNLRFIGKKTDIHLFPQALTEGEIAGLYRQEYAALHH